MPFGDSIDAVAQRIARIRAPLSVKLQTAFFVIIVVLLATGLISLTAVGRIERQAAELDTVDQAVALARTLDYCIVAHQHLSSMLLLTGEVGYHTKLLAEREKFRSGYHRLRTFGVGPEDIRKIDDTFNRYAAASDAAVKARAAGDLARAQAIHVDQEHVLAHEIETLTRSAVARMQTDRQAVLARILREQRHANWTVSVLFLLSIGVALALGWLFARSIVDPIRQVDATLSRIARGEFATVPAVANQDELGSLAANVDRMSQQLAQLYARERAAARELQEQYESLRKTQAGLIKAEKLRALGEMAGGVAHDFNNLLAIVLGQAEFMAAQLEANRMPKSEISRRLGVVQTAALDGAETVRRLLDFTRATPRPTEFQMVAVRELLTSVLAIAEPRWKDQAHATGRQIDVRLDVADVPPVFGNPAELREVLLNLIFNALDAMPDGGSLTVSARREADRICLAVSDTGTGMPEETQSRIFEPFFTTKGPQRSGLGLSVSYGIVRRHDGDLTVESGPGRGTTMTLVLPVRAGLAEPAREEGVPALTVAGRGVLVIDDEEPVRSALADLCREAGHRVWEATNGAEGLAILAREAIDLVCTDLGMPGMTGWEVADRVRARWPSVKVALITGWGARIEPADLEARTVDFLVAKPFRRADVRRVLAQIEAPAVR